MELNPSDVQNIEKLVRSVVTEVCRVRTSVPKFAGGKTFEKRLNSSETVNVARETAQVTSQAASQGVPVRRASAPIPAVAPVFASAVAPALAPKSAPNSSRISTPKLTLKSAPNPDVASPSSSVFAVKSAVASHPETISREASETATNSKRPRLKSDELLLDKQVVTLRDVENLPKIVKRLIVPQTALLTPSVRDILSEQAIRLARYSRETIESLRTDAPQTASSRLRSGAIEVYALFTPFHPETLFASWTKAGWSPNLHSGFVGFDDLRESIAKNQAKNQTLSILFTSRTDEALCQLNRNERIFAVSAVSPQRLGDQWRVFSSINAIVTNPSELGAYLAGQIVQRAAELFYL